MITITPDVEKMPGSSACRGRGPHALSSVSGAVAGAAYLLLNALSEPRLLDAFGQGTAWVGIVKEASK